MTNKMILYDSQVTSERALTPLRTTGTRISVCMEAPHTEDTDWDWSDSCAGC